MAHKSTTWSSQIAAFFRDMDPYQGIDQVFSAYEPAQKNYRIRQDKGCTTIDLQVPGCAPKNVDLALAGGIITVVATPGGGLPQSVYHFRVGVRVRAEDITATVLNGILSIVARNGVPEAPQGKIPVT